MKARFLPLLLVVLLAACNNNSSTTTTPSSTIPTSQLNVFTGTLSPQTPFFYAFSTGTEGSVAVTFVGAVDSTGATLDFPVTLGLGVPKGTGCATTQTTTASPGLAAQLKGSVGASTYCINVIDNGALTSDVTFTLKLVYPLDPTVTGSAATETFASAMTPTGAATRTFRASGSGTATVTLQGVTPSATMGLGVGIPGADGLGCNFARAIRATTGGSISLLVDAGSYCVKVYDVGTLTGTASFSVDIAHP